MKRVIVLTCCALFASACPSDDTQNGDTTTSDVTADTRTDAESDAIGTDQGSNVNDDGQTSNDATTEPDLVPWDGQNYGEGKLGDPCLENVDCNSGWCIQGPDGLLCTQICLESCPAGYSCKVLPLPDPVSVCAPNVLDYCGPCQGDISCFGGVCLNDGANDPYCTALCSADNPCPEGFDCQQTTDATTGLSRDTCVPTSGSCECSTVSSGAVRPCQKSNEFGTCEGFETCNGSEWGNCNAREPAAELCDYQDNNCDGTVDEGFLNATSQYDKYEHCGVCGQTCEGAIANAVTACDGTEYDPPQCVVEDCAAGFFKLNSFYCGPVPAKLCSPCAEDANCIVDGAKCSQLADGTYCTVPCLNNDECPGGYSCTELDGAQQCVPDSGTCACDPGSVGLQRSCEESYQDPQNPQAPVVTCIGLETCEASGWTECALGVDICDYSDNDCDGVIDNEWVNEDGLYFRDENCGVCGNNCLAEDPPPNSVAACDISGTVPTCGIQCIPNTADVNGNPVDGCECVIDGIPDVPDGIDHDCDGVDGSIDGAIFVAKNGSNANSGAIDAPLLTIQAGIDKAAADGKAYVFVATGVYAESVTLVAGVMAFGGYSGDFRARDVGLYQTAVFGQAPTSEQPGAINAVGIDGNGEPSGISGFTVFGYVNKTSGASSYAVYVRNCGDQLQLLDNTIFAGSGGDGDAGTGGTSGAAGTDGNGGQTAIDLGSDSCAPSDHRDGGAGGINSCGGADVSGGAGGTASCPNFMETENTTFCPATANQNPAAAENGVSGSGSSGGSGGAAGGDSYLNALDGPYSNCQSDEANCTVCKLPTPASANGAVGSAGSSGTPGTAGTGCEASQGTVADGLWSASAGGSGALGQAGSGGGGGGAGGGVETTNCSAIAGGTDLGGSGGGGGSGGCGGTGGAGGTGGGGSFGVFVTWSAAPSSSPVVSGNTIVRGQGGDGGSGGTGASGGAGGGGGAAGASDKANNATFCAPSGGAGGNGGTGGAGGGGGGGCGGVSYGIFVAGGSGDPAWTASNAFDSDGTSGSGGPGGLSLGNPGSTGQKGAEGDANF